jgi:hypothetical protein
MDLVGMPETLRTPTRLPIHQQVADAGPHQMQLLRVPPPNQGAPMISIPNISITRTPGKTETVTTKSRSIALADIHDGPVRVDTTVKEVTTPEQWSVFLTPVLVDCGDDEHSLAWFATKAEALDALNQLIERAALARQRIIRGEHD